MDQPTKYLRLMTSYTVTETSEPDPDDAWDRASTSTSWEILGIELIAADRWDALPADFPVQPGDTVHAVYVIYSSGDSFGHDAGSQLETLSFHKNRAVAERNLAAVRGPGDMVIEFDSGATVERYRPWDGYFESLDSADIVTFQVAA